MATETLEGKKLNDASEQTQAAILQEETRQRNIMLNDAPNQMQAAAPREETRQRNIPDECPYSLRKKITVPKKYQQAQLKSHYHMYLYPWSVVMITIDILPRDFYLQ